MNYLPEKLSSRFPHGTQQYQQRQRDLLDLGQETGVQKSVSPGNRTTYLDICLSHQGSMNPSILR